MGAPRKNNVDTSWSDSLSYVIGVMATDGNLSSDLRHLCITSKDYEMVINCKNYLQINNKIGRKARGGSKDKKYYVLQFGDKSFFEFLVKMGITPNKSKTISRLSVPDNYFPSFFLGCLDGDGNLSTNNHPESRHPQYRLRIFSASNNFLEWLKESCQRVFNVDGGSIMELRGKGASVLSFGKEDAIKIIRIIYKNNMPCLSRKRMVASEMLKKHTKAHSSAII